MEFVEVIVVVVVVAASYVEMVFAVVAYVLVDIEA